MGFLYRNEETEALYKAEEKLHKALDNAARETLLLNGDKPKKLDEFQEKGYWEFPDKFYSQGIPSALYQLLESCDKKAVDLAVLVYITNNWDRIRKFKKEIDESAEQIPKDL